MLYQDTWDFVFKAGTDGQPASIVTFRYLLAPEYVALQGRLGDATDAERGAAMLEESIVSVAGFDVPYAGGVRVLVWPADRERLRSIFSRLQEVGAYSAMLAEWTKRHTTTLETDPTKP